MRIPLLVLDKPLERVVCGFVGDVLGFLQMCGFGFGDFQGFLGF